MDITPDGEYFEEPVVLNAEQEFIWDVRKEALKGAKKIAKKQPVTFLHLGDVVQGFKHTAKYVSASPYAQQCIANKNVEPVFDTLNVERTRFVYGTMAHDGTYHDGIRAITAHTKGFCPDTKMLRHGLIDVGGTLIDYSHHGSGKGRRTWLKGNEMRYYTKSIMSQELKRGRKPPDVMLRGHFHGFHWETVRERINNQWYTTELILVPSFCGLGAYGQQVTRSEYMINNGAIMLDIGDRVNVHDWVIERDLRTKEVI